LVLTAAGGTSAPHGMENGVEAGIKGSAEGIRPALPALGTSAHNVLCR
jgi:hypothetical protein